MLAYREEKTRIPFPIVLSDACGIARKDLPPTKKEFARRAENPSLFSKPECAKINLGNIAPENVLISNGISARKAQWANVLNVEKSFCIIIAVKE